VFSLSAGGSVCRPGVELTETEQETAGIKNFVASDPWAVLGDESVSGFASHDFAVIKGLTAATQPALQLLCGHPHAATGCESTAARKFRDIPEHSPIRYPDHLSE
jgi:hypothetical protein